MSPSTHPNVEQRAKGGILGVCTCDALGGPIQFSEAGRFKPVTLEEPLRPMLPFGAPAGAWSDDGSMTLALADSLVSTSGRLDCRDVLMRFVSWFLAGDYSSLKEAFDIGNATTQSLNIWAEGGVDADSKSDHLDKIQDTIDKQLNHFRASGNGSLMRCVSIGIVMHKKPLHEAQRAAREQSDLTHPYSACGDACSLYTALVVKAMCHGSKQELHDIVQKADVSDRQLRRILSAYPTLNSWSAKDSKSINSTGWVLTTLEVALWAFFATETFEDGALKCVNTGGDSDTTGAVYGGLAGVFYGVDAIPGHWASVLLKRPLVDRIANSIATLASIQS